MDDPLAGPPRPALWVTTVWSKETLVVRLPRMAEAEDDEPGFGEGLAALGRERTLAWLHAFRRLTHPRRTPR
jgi:hypothetical protein